MCVEGRILLGLSREEGSRLGGMLEADSDVPSHSQWLGVPVKTHDDQLCGCLNMGERDCVVATNPEASSVSAGI